MPISPQNLFGAFPVKLRYIACLVVASLAVTAAYVVYPNLHEELKFFLSVIGGAAVIFGCYYNAITLRQTLQDRRKEHAFALINAQSDMADARKIVGELIRQPNVSPADLTRNICSDIKLRAYVDTILCHIENISIAIQNHYVDEQVLHSAAGTFVSFYSEGLTDYIDEVRKMYKSDTIYCELKELAAAWKAKRSLATGQRLD